MQWFWLIFYLYSSSRILSYLPPRGLLASSFLGHGAKLSWTRRTFLFATVVQILRFLRLGAKTFFADTFLDTGGVGTTFHDTGGVRYHGDN